MRSHPRARECVQSSALENDYQRRETRCALLPRGGRGRHDQRRRHVRHLPDEDRALGADRDDRLLVGRDGDALDRARVTESVKVRAALLIVPHLDDLVAAGRHKGRAVVRDGERVDLGARRRVRDADGRAVDHVPDGHLAVRAGRQQLRLVRVVERHAELRRGEKAIVAHEARQVPRDARAVGGRAHRSGWGERGGGCKKKQCEKSDSAFVRM